MAVKTYSLKTQGKVYCSKHTQVKEMACKDGTDTVLIDEKLMEMIEKLFSKLNCGKYIISSGYRTPKHDKAVGGNGSGQHTKGKAVDACFYDKNNKLISAKIVCCVAQDIGFKGIANISSKYQYVHLDMRSAGTYKGDEIKHYNTVTKDFYDYFNISKADVAKYTGEVIKPAAPKVTYFKKYTGASGSIVAALKAIGAKSDFAYRSKTAKANNIKLYVGTAAQNTKMLNLLKQGKLIKP
jgi:hypothetical protein